MTLALSGASSSSSSTQLVPLLTFIGPDGASQISATNCYGQEVARFIVQGTKRSSFTIARMVGLTNAPSIQICSAEKSSMSGSITMVVHGQNIKVKRSMEPLTEGWLVETSTMSTLRWHQSGNGAWQLEDKGKVVLAKGNTEGSRLEVFVSADETTLDTLLAVWVAMSRAESASAERVHAAMEIVGALFGAGA